MTTKSPQRKRKATARSARPLEGKRIAFFGEFAVWPSYHLATPAEVASRLGAKVVTAVDDDLDLVVFGELRGKGRAEAKKKAEKLAGRAGKRRRPEILDEAAYRELVRIRLEGKTFAFAGEFDCSPGGQGLLAGMVEGVGAKVVEDVTAALDYLAVGNHRGPGKIARINEARRLAEGGAGVRILDETSFLELVRSDRPPAQAPGGELGFSSFVGQLYGTADQGKLGRALTMLKTDSFKLYSHVDPERLVGVVRSQTGSGSVYASWLRADGAYGCSQPDLEDCMGLQGTVCKHLLVLLVGLTRKGQMSTTQALEWARAAARRSPQKDPDLCAETFLRYKGAEAGEVDWRPTFTIPEDYSAV